MPYSRGECGDFASVQLRGDWERSTVRSIDDMMAEEKFRTAYKLLRTEKVDFFFKNIHKNVLKFLKHHSNRSEYSGNLRTLCLEAAMNHHDRVFSLVLHQSEKI